MKFTFKFTLLIFFFFKMSTSILNSYEIYVYKYKIIFNMMEFQIFTLNKKNLLLYYIILNTYTIYFLISYFFY